jgi:succinate-semialdehyde dehydrogenase/glutarate-semialdehyde dehydrogenase
MTRSDVIAPDERSKSFPVVDPATEITIREYPAISREDAATLIDAVHAAFLDWRHTSFPARAHRMHAAAAVFRARKSALAELVHEEMGKTIDEAREEVEKCAFGCDFYAVHAEKMLAPEVLSANELRSGGGSPGERASVVCNPLGVILALMPWNFPLWQVVRFLAPGLMAGNACVLKHANNTPGCGLALESVFREAGFPPDLFRAALVDIPEVEHLILHPRVAAVTLTGSVEAGRSVAAIAGRALKKCVLELGGSDPYLILEDADLELAARVCTEARLRNAGQSCIAAKRFIVVDAVREEFERRFTARMQAWPALPPLATRKARDRLHAQVVESQRQGARLLLGGVVPAGAGAHYPPTILTDVAAGMSAYTEELFGPVAAIIAVADERRAIETANDTTFGLGAAVFTRDVGRGERIAAESLQAGAAFVNASVRSMPALPFGGIRHSGYGRELSRHGILEFVNLKSVLVHT